MLFRSLLAEHNLSMSELEAREEGAGEVELRVARSVPKWVSSLFATVANDFDCFPSGTTTVTMSRLRFIGVGEAPEVALCTMQYLMGELKRLATVYLGQTSAKGRKPEGAERDRIRNSYLLGGVYGVRQAMAAQKAETPTTSMALVPVKEALIKQYRDERIGAVRMRRTRRSTVLSDAFQKGKQDGASLQMRKGGAAKGHITAVPEQMPLGL